MEEFKQDEDPREMNNQLQLDTERSSEPNTQRDKFRSADHHPVFNDTIETLDNE